jgi:hypothetical protein
VAVAVAVAVGFVVRLSKSGPVKVKTHTQAHNAATSCHEPQPIELLVLP